MSAKVRKLPEHLIRLIAAGEVIERPASVVKELVENSLDAGATKLTIDIHGAGQTQIRIADNGSGMSKEDAELALDRHATSKLTAFDDLHSLKTFGFRGEALPSIAAISRLQLTTRSSDSPTGWRMILEGGTLKESSAAGVSVGTIMDVQDLFFNTPARAKFLKRESTERSHILRTIQELAIVHPEVQWEVTMEGRSVLSLVQGTLEERLHELWKLEEQALTPVQFAVGPCRIHGLVSTSAGHQGTKGFQIFFVNERPVQQKSLLHAVYEAYRDNLPVGRHPAFALFIDIDPSLVDVNVHPAKREVRFSDDRAVYDALYRAVRERQAPIAPATVPGVDVRTIVERPSVISRKAMQSFFEPSTAQRPMNAPFLVADTSTKTTEAAPWSTPTRRFLGQFQLVYLLFDEKGEFLVVDQHAAAERVLYERLLKETNSTPPARQALLSPILVDVTADQAQWLNDLVPHLDRFGFSLEPFGSRTFALKEWPASLPNDRQAKRFVDELLSAFEADRPSDHTQIQHEIAARAACRSAIMAGDPVTGVEALQLVDDLNLCDRPETCPHGRPTSWRLTLEEMHKHFRRP